MENELFYLEDHFFLEVCRTHFAFVDATVPCAVDHGLTYACLYRMLAMSRGRDDLCVCLQCDDIRGQPNSSLDSCSSDLKVAHSPHGWKVTYVITDLISLPLIQETFPS